MDRLKRIYAELVETVNNSRLYLVNYFSELKSQIDIECETYLSKGALGTKDEEKAIEQQIDMIHQVDLFQSKCLDKLKKHTIEHLTNLSEFEHRLNHLHLMNTDAVLELEKKLYCVLYERKRVLFMNKGIVFLSIEDYEAVFIPYYLIDDGPRDPNILFGILKTHLL